MAFLPALSLPVLEVFFPTTQPPSIPLLVLSGTCEALGPLGGSTPAGSLLSMQQIYLKIHIFLTSICVVCQGRCYGS